LMIVLVQHYPYRFSSQTRLSHNIDEAVLERVITINIVL
jgi:hypothetical protein